MGWRFRRSLKVGPGIKVNLGKAGVSSLSIGGHGATLNVGKRGVTTTVSVPGTGLSYQHRYTNGQSNAPSAPRPSTASVGGKSAAARVFIIFAIISIGYLILRH